MTAHRPLVSDAALGIVADLEQAFGRVTPVAMRGRVIKAVGMLIDATGIQAHVGELCELVTPGEPPLLAEVVGFRNNTAILTPLGPITGISMRWGNRSTIWARWPRTCSSPCIASRSARSRAA
jgi:type III secretion protein N (ATPase)